MNNKFISIKRLMGAAALVVVSFVAHAATVLDVQLDKVGSQSILTIALDGTSKYKHFKLDNPDRIVVDLIDADMVKGLKALLPTNEVVKGVRTGVPKAGVLRLVIDLAASPKRYQIGDYTQTSGIQVVTVAIAMSEDSAPLLKTPQGPTGPKLQTDKPAPAPTPAPVVAPAKPAAVSIKEVLVEKKQYVITIDAGHGGHDPGATGPRGTKEKEVTAQIARRLYDILEADPKFKPVLSRPDDKKVLLRHRTEAARKADSDLFISLHADSFSKSDVRGASVYTVSATGATSEHARWLAEKENAADLVGGISIYDKEGSLASVLLDLVQDETIESGLTLGEYILKEIRDVARLHKRTVQSAGFVVLKSPDIPSVLVELGFISNPTEEKLLRSKSYQSKLANSLFAGVKNYFNNNPLMVMQRSKVHTIESGDTLSKIADQYGVTVAAVRSANRLRSDVISVGKTLTIPPRS
jgi:N-acetylmuramoyl-L-alanine amidase